MLESHYLYLLLMLASVSIPFSQSFEHRIRFYKNWKALFWGIGVMMAVFIPWDIAFTHLGVWWFRDDYITGWKMALLPLEEWLFFILIPYACVFMYEALRYLIKKPLPVIWAQRFFGLLSIVLLLLSFYYFPNYYTCITFSLTALACAALAMIKPPWISHFLVMYLASWIPFLLVNGVLTGNFTRQAIVNYNSEEIIGLRITTIPVEDSMYSLLMLLLVVAVYEWKKKGVRQISP